jgi:outer membrane protein assembly factor BamE (lipoprotein component of BamABCDE complex)
MAGLLTSLLALFGCDPARIAKLEEGVSTEADVRKQFGDPVDVITAADGSRTLEYPRQPEGWTNYFITIGVDGKMSALRQVLTARNFARVTPGLDKSELRPILGRPAQTQRYALKEQEVWDWRYKNGQASRLFSVTLDNAGKVVATASIDDPKETVGGPSK